MGHQKQRQPWLRGWHVFLCFVLTAGIVLPKVPAVSATGEAVEVLLEGGAEHSLALNGDGIALAWGANWSGQLGDGTTANRSTPVQVQGLTGVIAIASGGYHSLALKSDGTVWAWGGNGYGQLGDGTTANRSTPVQVRGLTGVIAIAGGYDHSLALKSDGTVWAWGGNSSGKLGDGTTMYRLTPVQVQGLTGVIAIAGGRDHSLALKSDGTVWAWGRNNYGQLGDRTTNGSNMPVQVQSLSDVIAIAAGGYHSLALKSDGTVWAWGWNDYGQLGDRTTNDSNMPVQVQSLSDVIAIAAGGNHSLALKSDGTVWAWGWNVSGQLGDGTTANRSTPVQVRGLTGVIAIAGGYDHSLALKSDGTVWAWGRNNYGQLGDGSTNESTIPLHVFNCFSSNAFLEDLTLSTGELNPNFSKNIERYVSTVPYETSQITVTPVTEHPRATVTAGVNGGMPVSVTRGKPSPPLPLDVGQNEIHIEVLAQDKITRKTYIIQITREASANLRGIRLGSGALLGDFNPDTMIYTVNVPHDTASLTVTPIAVDPQAAITVSINGGPPEPVVSEQSSSELNLNVGVNIIEIHVTSRDGTKNKTYTLQVTRVASNNANIKRLEVFPGSLHPDFSMDTVAYVVYGAGKIDKLEITAELDDPDATMTIAGEEAISGVTETVYLQHGHNLIPIVVTAADKVTQKTYVFSVDGTLSDADLADLQIDGKTVAGFDPDTTDYALQVAHEVSSVEVTGELSDSEAMLIVNGSPQPSGVSRTIDLKVGENVILLRVVARDGTTKEYKVMVTRAAANSGGSVGGDGSGGDSERECDDSGETGGGSVGGGDDPESGSGGGKVTLSPGNANWQAEDETQRGQPIQPNDPHQVRFTDIRGHWAEGDILLAAQLGIVGGYPDGSFRPNRPATRLQFILMLVKAQRAKGPPAAPAPVKSPPPAADGLPFKDARFIPEWAQPAVAYAVRAGIVKGYPDGTLRPDAYVSRQEMAVMLARLLLPDGKAAVRTTFADDAEIPDWAKASVNAVAAKGLIRGREGNRFDPGAPATRAQAVVTLTRWMRQP